jgi:hypothetical protein
MVHQFFTFGFSLCAIKCSLINKKSTLGEEKNQSDKDSKMIFRRSFGSASLYVIFLSERS